MPYYYWQKEDLWLKVYVQPRAKVNRIVGEYNGQLKIQIKSPPVDDKANGELIKFLAKYLQIAASKICLMQGERSRSKLVCLKSVSWDIVSSLESATKANAG